MPNYNGDVLKRCMLCSSKHG